MSYFEVLVSLLLLSILLLGLDAMGFWGLKQNEVAWSLRVAAQQMDSMVERLQALQDLPGLTHQVDLWNQENQLVLIHGQGTVIGQFPDYQIAIHWGEFNTESCPQSQTGMNGCLRESIHLA